MPVDEALEIARQIADALEAAHEKGIVHRDLKPANVKRTPAGSVKVLDFGLAKALKPDGSSPDVTSSPTMTAQSTQAGVVIGTAAYMSPEQARGKAVDKRTDIWAFGAVLFEMLTGKKTFGGETVSDTLAAVLKTDPDWSALPPDTPSGDPPAPPALPRSRSEEAPARHRGRAHRDGGAAEEAGSAADHVAPGAPVARPWPPLLPRPRSRRSSPGSSLAGRAPASQPRRDEARAAHAGCGALGLAELVEGWSVTRVRLQPHRQHRDLRAAGRGGPGRRDHERSRRGRAAGFLARRRFGGLRLDALVGDRAHSHRRHLRTQHPNLWRGPLGRSRSGRRGEAPGARRELPRVAARRVQRFFTSRARRTTAP